MLKKIDLFKFKHYDIIHKEIGDIKQEKYYHFFTEGRWSMHETLLYLLSYTGKANVIVTSFSLSEITIRAFVKAMQQGFISDFQLLLEQNRFIAFCR